MLTLKKHILKIGLIIALAISILLCIYTVGNYKSNNTNNVTQGESFKRDMQPPKGVNKAQGNNENSKQMNPPNETSSATKKADSSNSKANKPSQQSGKMRSAPNMNNKDTKSNNNYGSMLIAYSLAFLALFAAGYYLFIHKKTKINADNAIWLIVTLLLIGFFARISIASVVSGYSSDINLFKNWASTAANNFLKVYSNARSSDYPPLYMYVLFLIGKLASISALNPYYTLLLKLPSIIADIITSILIYKFAKKHFSLEIGILLSAFYIFNPAVFINSSMWGQVDSFFALIVTLAIYTLSEKKIGISSMLFTAAVLMKPQGIIFLPILFFELVRQRNLKNFLKAAALAILVAAIVILPFSMNQSPLWIFKLYSGTVGEYPYASVNAFNFYSLIGKNYAKDTNIMFLFSYHTWGMIFIVAVTLFSWFIYIKGNDSKFAPAAALLQIAGVFTFSTSMHERYLFPAAVLAILSYIYIKDKRLLILALGFSSTIYMNTYAILFQTFKGANGVSYSPVLIVTSLLNVILFIYLVKVLWDIAVRKKLNNLFS